MGAGKVNGCYREKLQMTSEATIRLKLCVSLFLAAASFAAAQSSLTAPGTAYTTLPSPGSGHNDIQGLSETVDPSTGSLTIQLPIPMPSGRGMTLPFSILYNSNASVTPLGGPTTYSNIGSSAVVGGVNVSGGTYFGMGGWTYTLPVAGYTQVSQVMQASSLETTLNPQGLITCYYNVNWTFWDPSGAAKALGLYTVPWGQSVPSTPTSYPCLGQGSSPASVSGYPGAASALGQIPEVLSSSGYGVEATVLSAASYESPQSLSNLQVSDRDGNVYSFNSAAGGLASSIEDRNGNILSIQALSNGFTITDTTGQVVLSSTATQNTSTLTVRGEASYQLTNETIAVGSNTAQVLKSITLPNGEVYGFTYQAYELSSSLGTSWVPLLQTITYPTGATVSYQWTAAPDRQRGIQVLSSGVFPQNIQITSGSPPSVHTRTVSFDGQSPALEQTFSYPEPSWVASDGNYLNTNNFAWTSEQTSVITTDELGGPSYTTTYT
jgi:hypothetical protein